MPNDSRFEFSGGNLALDLANTVSRRPTDTPVEALEQLTDVLEWSREAGLLSPPKIRRLMKEAVKNRRRSSEIFAKAIEFRELLFRIFSAVAASKNPEGKDVEQWSQWTARAFSHLALKPAGRGESWEWEIREADLDFMFWPIVLAATELLKSSESRLVRQCEARDCDWLFVDRSRKKNRRWCDMKVCGNREKARRFYAKKR